jgi:hypothetical protein
MFKRYWIIIIGFSIAFGFIVNCCLFPFFDIKQIDWQYLTASCFSVLGISGARDILRKKE